MRRKLSISFALLLCAPAIAVAQTPAPEQGVQAAATATADPLAKENWPLSMVDRPLGVSAGMLQVDINGATVLSKDSAGKPATLPLAFWYGVTNQLQLGLLHANGVCISGKSNNCAKVYDDVALQALYSISGRGSNFELAALAQLNYTSFDKGTMNLQVGPSINWVIAGNAALLAYPVVQFGLTKRDAPNKEGIDIPLYLYLRAGTHVAPVIYTRLTGPFSGFGDAYTVPLGAGALVGINTTIDVGLRFDFTNLLGHHADGVGAADGRSLLAWVSVRPL